jgi:hypothetical protein
VAVPGRPAIAAVATSSPAITCATSSNQPVPTSRSRWVACIAALLARDSASWGRDEITDGLRGRQQHLAAHVAALLLGRELVLEVHPCRAGFAHGPHQLEDTVR